MKKLLFIDRDGTLIREAPPSYQLDCFSKLEFYPDMFRYMRRIAEELDYELVMVTNQDGLGTPAFPEEQFWPVHQHVMKSLENENIRFSAVHIDRSFPHEQLSTRKPGTGMLARYIGNPDYDLAGSFVIGDRITDMQLAKNLGCRGIWLCTDAALGAAETGDAPEILRRETVVLETPHWAEIYGFLRWPPRLAAHRRTTHETDIRISLNLDGSGRSDIRTGIGFFDHMLDQLARHGQIDLELQCEGDLHVDEHHTVEDTGIALGEALHRALGDKRGIGRYAFVLPMDDCLAQVALDFGGRSWLVWDAEFRREKIGDMPTEMFAHFFKSFCDAARCNLNVQVRGENEHHKIESIFKAFARCIRQAVKRDAENTGLPSTKGIL